jgi:hypothetical protein
MSPRIKKNMPLVTIFINRKYTIEGIRILNPVPKNITVKEKSSLCALGKHISEKRYSSKHS